MRATHLTVLIAVAAGLAGCAGGQSTAAPESSPAPSVVSNPAATTPASSAPATTSSPTATSDAAALVGAVVMRTGDLPKLTATLLPQGDQVDGQVTLDNCGYAFTSESHRVARRQVAGDLGMEQAFDLSNEVVAYESEKWAAKALEEWRASVATCPKDTFVPSKVADAPDMKYDVLRPPATSADLPVADNVTTYEKVTTKDGQSAYAIMVIQRKGTVLDAVYLMVPSGPEDSDFALADRLAQVTGKRLAEHA